MNNLFIGILLSLALPVLSIGQSQPLFVQDVSWSPDGKYIVFQGLHDFDQAKNSFKTDIYIVRTDGSEMKKISSDETNEYYSAFGRGRIYFGVEKTGTKISNIYSAKPDGSDLRQITNSEKRDATPGISRDGKRIVFASSRDGDKYQIYISNADGTNVRRLTNDPLIGYYNPQISPDGKQIVYYTEKGDSKDQVWTMNIDGSDKKLLTANIGHNIFPGWSADSKEIIFASSKRDTDSAGSYVDGSYLYLIRADGTGLRKLGSINSFFARLSPDGKRLAYISGRFPTSDIYIANADGSNPVQITKQ
jgi:TolB protein